MADDGLSQAELETLLSRVAPLARPKEAAPRRAAASGPPTAPPGVQPHDFKRPRAADDDQLRALTTLHAGFARNLGAVLSAMLRSVVEAKLASVEQVSYREFIAGLESPTCLSVLRSPALHGPLALDVSPSILFAMIDRLLGGAGKPGPLTRRPLTDIEHRLASRVTAAVCDELARVWQNVAELTFSVERVECDPQAARLVLAHEAVVRIGFELTVHAARGPLCLCLPLGALRPITGQLTQGSSAATGQAAPIGTDAPLCDSVRQSTVELVVHLAETRVAASELLNLRAGDIVTTNQHVGAPLEVCVAGRPKFRAQPGAFQGHKAVRIDEPLSPPPGGPSP